MTTSDHTHTTSSPPRPRPRPDLVPDTPQGTGETTSSPGPPPYGGDEVAEPSRGRPAHLVPDTGTTSPGVRRCRTCGCTDLNACINLIFGPCWWAEPDLCSYCQ